MATKKSLDDFINASTGVFRDAQANTASDMRDFIDTAFGGLFLTDETADSNVTGVVGSLHVIEMNSGTPFTADRDFVLPTSANTGDRVGVACKDGDASYEILLKSGAAGDLINGVDHSTNEWSRLFIAGELVVFVCVDGATADWLVERDGRIPCCAVYESSSGLSCNNNTDTPMDLSVMTEESNQGNCADTTNDYFAARRDGIYVCGGSVYWSTGLSTDDWTLLKVEDYKGAAWNDPNGFTVAEASNATELVGVHNDRQLHLSVDERAQPVIKQTSGGAVSTSSHSCYFHELL